jgi:HK97 family phage prohead protease
MKHLHPKIKELQTRFKGVLPQFTSIDQNALQTRASFSLPPAEDETDHYVALFGVPDSYKTVAIRGCFAKSINDRGPQSKANEKIIHLWMHDRHEPLGQPVLMEEDAIGLKVRIKWDVSAGGTPYRIFNQTKSGTIRQNSYGFEYVWDKMEYDEEKDAILMYEAALFETSSVSILSSNPEAATFRTAEELNSHLSDLSSLAEDLIASVPFKHRLELRQLLTRYKSLLEIKPDLLSSLKEEQPSGVLKVGDYKLDLNKM